MGRFNGPRLPRHYFMLPLGRIRFVTENSGHPRIPRAALTELVPVPGYALDQTVSWCRAGRALARRRAPADREQACADTGRSAALPPGQSEQVPRQVN